MQYRFKLNDGRPEPVKPKPEKALKPEWWHVNNKSSGGGAAAFSGESDSRARHAACASPAATPLDVLEELVSAMNRKCDVKWLLRAMATFPGKRCSVDGVALAKAILKKEFPRPNAGGWAEKP